MTDPSAPPADAREPHAPRDPSGAAAGDASARPQPALPVVGERLGVWRVSAALFECASGQWYRVEHALASAQAGLALVYRHEADAQAVLMRFAEDSEALSRLAHPTYGAPLDSGLSPAGLPYLVVPPMDGAPLLRVAMALPLKRRMQLLLDLIDMLEWAHAQGLVLHEIDPGTLWLSPGQQLHWLGQGLAPRDSQGPTALVRAAEPLANARQRAGGRPDENSETHALGRLLGLLVNGRLPRREGAEEGGEDEAEPGATPVASLQSWLSLTAAQRESLDQLLDRAMMDGRSFTDRQLLAQAVRDWIDTEPAPGPARSAGGAGPASASLPLLASPPPLEEPHAPAKPPAASIAERVAGIALVLALAAIVLWLLLRSG
ncbi:hypothetical protein CDN99_23470 [Roseateles aquatilis]|uniref:Protein kinase domain-containing protein n=1 Tax=Roseateles aquatilis TaxID=431061 RepID=A0A246IY21_9BURK|nr:hypothetical protein [Roseateles aquatilis]OWQ84699.1 hypothetical protein CDN99_23470 [Roseateles aquatilis]